MSTAYDTGTGILPAARAGLLASLVAGCLASSACHSATKDLPMTNESMPPPVSAGEIAVLFQASPRVIEANAWSPVAPIDDNMRFQRRVRFEGSDDVTIAVAINARGGDGQRSMYREIRDARDKRRLPPALSTSFGLEVLDGGANAFRQYLIGNDDTNLLCTYEGIGAPEPFVRCSWSRGPAAYSIETAPVAIHYALSSRSEIEHLVATSGEL
jgi:hypothetical protein